MLSQTFSKKVRAKGKGQKTIDILRDIQGLSTFIEQYQPANILFLILYFWPCFEVFIPNEETEKAKTSVIKYLFETLSKQKELSLEAEKEEIPALIFIHIKFEPSIEAFECIKTIFKHIQSLIPPQVSLLLDKDTVDLGQTKLVPLDSSYFSSYAQVFCLQEEKAKEDSDNLPEEVVPPLKQGEYFTLSSDKIAKEYSLTTLDLNKVSLIDFEGAKKREDGRLTSQDITFLSDFGKPGQLRKRAPVGSLPRLEETQGLSQNRQPMEESLSQHWPMDYGSLSIEQELKALQG